MDLLAFGVSIIAITILSYEQMARRRRGGYYNPVHPD